MSRNQRATEIHPKLLGQRRAPEDGDPKLRAWREGGWGRRKGGGPGGGPGRREQEWKRQSRRPQWKIPFIYFRTQRPVMELRTQGLRTRAFVFILGALGQH